MYKSVQIPEPGDGGRWRSSSVAADTRDKDNVIDIVGIHQKIAHQIGRILNEHPTSDPDGSIALNFDFYLVQALPLLTAYQKCIKDRGKIRFSSPNPMPPSGAPQADVLTKHDPVLTVGGDMSKKNVSDLKQTSSSPDAVARPGNRAPFPYVQYHGNGGKLDSKEEGMIEDMIGEYIQLVERYFPEQCQQMDIGPLMPTPAICSPHKPVSSQISPICHIPHTPHVAPGHNPPSDLSVRPPESAQGGVHGCSHPQYVMSPDGLYVCETCGLTPDQDQVSTTISFKDISRVNLASKYLYDRITHFKDCINQFQGKQNCTIDPKVYDNLIEQFLSHDLIPVDYKNLPKESAFRNITKEHIMVFLKECGHTKHYEDAVLIHSVLTGTPPPDITGLENQLLHDFDQLTTLYDKKYRHQDRKNFINTQYVLYQLLKRHKFPCKKEDFNILKTIDRKFYHDDICKALFEELDWNFNPTF